MHGASGHHTGWHSGIFLKSFLTCWRPTSSQYLVCVHVSVSHTWGNEHHRCEMKSSPGPSASSYRGPLMTSCISPFPHCPSRRNQHHYKGQLYVRIFFFLSISLSLWSQNLSCPLKVLCGLVSKRVGYVWYFLLPMIFILWVYISMNCFSKLHCV